MRQFLAYTKDYGQFSCVLLYSAFSVLAAKKKPIPLIVLFVMHLGEYFLVGKKVAKENYVYQPVAVANCLAFGFTWWLPLKFG